MRKQLKPEKLEEYYKERLLKNYFSMHHQEFIPKTKKQWNYLLDRLKNDMGKYFNNLNKDSCILDVGCGVGYLEHYLINNGFTNIYAIDISKEQIEMAKQCLTKNKIHYEEKIKFKNENIFEHFKHEDLSYDIITLIDVLEHLKKYEALELMEIAHNALNEKGTLLIRVPNMEHPFNSSYKRYEDFTHEIGFTRSSLKQCLLATGFTENKVKFEKNPPVTSNNTFYNNLKNTLTPSYNKVLGFILRTSPDSFNSNIIATGIKSDIKSKKNKPPYFKI